MRIIIITKIIPTTKRKDTAPNDPPIIADKFSDKFSDNTNAVTGFTNKKKCYIVTLVRSSNQLYCYFPELL